MKEVLMLFMSRMLQETNLQLEKPMFSSLERMPMPHWYPYLEERALN